MRKAFLTLALLAAGCAGDASQDLDVVTTHQRQTQTRVVAEKHVEVSPSLHLVGEEQPVARPAQPQPAPPSQTAAEPAPQVAEQKPPQLDFLQVGPPIVINTVPTPTPAVMPEPLPSVSFVRPVAPVAPATPESELPTATGFQYRNGGVNGTTAPLATSTPVLPTAEGFEYRP